MTDIFCPQCHQRLPAHDYDCDLGPLSLKRKNSVGFDPYDEDPYARGREEDRVYGDPREQLDQGNSSGNGVRGSAPDLDIEYNDWGDVWDDDE